MAKEAENKSVAEIAHEETNYETPRMVNRVSTVSLIVFPAMLIALLVLIFIYYMMAEK